MVNSPVIAFFDMDRTVIRSNSAKGWVRREYLEGNIRLWDLLKASGWLFLYGLGKVDLDDPIRYGAGLIAGTKEEAIRMRCERFWEEEIRFDIRSDARDTIERHRTKGDILVLLTSSTNYLADLVAKELGFEYVLSNIFFSKEGVLTGEVQEPLCFGRGKVKHAQNLAGKLGVSLQDCYFYTDSFSDVHVLRSVGYPIVVTPDVRLKKEAKSNGWAIEDWD
jgi:HAD superfamily hydrolase (TIGR01490 family)